MAKRKHISSTSASGTRTKKRTKRSGSSAVKKRLKSSSTSEKQTSIKVFTTSKTSRTSLSANSVNGSDSQSSNSQEKGRLGKNRQNANTSPQTERNHGRQAKKYVASVFELSSEDTRKTKFTQGQVDGWKSISASTVKLSEQIMQTGVSFVLSSSYGEMYDEVKEMVDEMSHKLLSKIKKLKVPASNIKDYKTVLQEKRSALQQIDLHEEQKDVLESAITRIEKECENLEEMEASISDDEIFPLLAEDYKAELDLPILIKKYNT